MKIKIALLGFGLFALSTMQAQADFYKGMPPLENFSPSQYHQQGKVWDITSAPNGIIYMAADKGLIEFDGKSWKAMKGSNGFHRSVLLANDSTLYTGSDLDFGIWKRNKFMNFEYISLYPFQEESKALNEEFWDIHQVDEKILFVSYNNIYIYKNQQLTKIPAPSKFKGSYKTDDAIYFMDEQIGLLKFNDLSLIPVFSFPDKQNIDLAGIYKDGNGLILVSRNAGLFKWSEGNFSLINNAISEILENAKVFSFVKIDEQQMAFGTVLNGVYIADNQGNIVHHINKKKGLANNTILSMHHSSGGKLWMGLDLGIASIELTSPFTYVYDFIGQFGSGYTAVLQNGIFYIGTNQGLYYTSWSSLNNSTELFQFNLVKGSEGQVWNLKIIGDRLFVCHDKGLFTIENNKLRRLSNEPGCWTIEQVDENRFLTGNYNGVFVYVKEDNQLRMKQKMDDIFGSCKQLLLESPQVLWIKIPNYGVIKAELDSDLKPVNRLIFEEHQFEGKVISIGRENDKIAVITNAYAYLFNSQTSLFDKNNDVQVPVALKGAIDGFTVPVQLNEDDEFYSLFNGFALRKKLNANNRNKGKHHLILRGIQIFNNDAIAFIHSDSLIPYQSNNVRLEWIVPQQKDVLYQFKKGAKSEWSALSNENIFELLNLAAGRHKIYARALIGNEFTDEYVLMINIARPWYASYYAYLLYFIFIVLAIYGISRRQKAILKKQRVQLIMRKEAALNEQAEKHKLEVLAMEQEILYHEFEQLKHQLKSKTLELANKAKDNEDKKHLLISLKEKFESIQNEPATAKIRMNEIKRLLETHLAVDNHTFEIQIDELNQEFFKKLKDRFPSLSLHDLRLCAYLKIGLNSKEIAEIMHILPSSVFVSRSRLRKKLNLTAEEDMLSFFNSLMND